MEQGKRELEIYIHIPFCVKKCGYCDFLSFPATEHVRQAYVDRLLEEIQGFEDAESYRVSTVFLGGGTPSILSDRQTECILQTVREHFPNWVCQAQDGREPEITIECNPGTLTEEKLQCYKRAGVSRLSLGLQSAQDAELKELGRIHSYAQFLESYALARNAGFSNINVDVMSALPGQSLESLRDTLHKVGALSPEHISAYSLILEEGTPFYERYGADGKRRDAGEEPQFLPSEEMERRMYEETQRILAQYGYQRYEISNYAKEGFACRHNTGYWNRTDYVGFGLGAASLQNPLRYQNTVVMTDYLNGDFSKKGLVVLTKDNQIEETMFLGLRMRKGVSFAAFAEKFGCPLTTVYGAAIKKLEKQGLIEEKEGYLRLTAKGTDVSNRVLAEFLLD